jgi:hypothetical protein
VNSLLFDFAFSDLQQSCRTTSPVELAVDLDKTGIKLILMFFAKCGPEKHKKFHSNQPSGKFLMTQIQNGGYSNAILIQ